VVVMNESQASYVVDAVKTMAARAIDIVDVRADAQARFNARLQAEMQGTVWLTGGCASWYLDSQARNTSLARVDLALPEAHPPLRRRLVPHRGRGARARPPTGVAKESRDQLRSAVDAVARLPAARRRVPGFVARVLGERLVDDAAALRAVADGRVAAPVVHVLARTVAPRERDRSSIHQKAPHPACASSAIMTHNQ
jgi:hypothetical protein